MTWTRHSEFLKQTTLHKQQLTLLFAETISDLIRTPLERHSGNKSFNAILLLPRCLSGWISIASRTSTGALSSASRSRHQRTFSLSGVWSIAVGAATGEPSVPWHLLANARSRTPWYRPSALHSTFHFWRKSRKNSPFLTLSSSKNEEICHNCFPSDVAKFKNWGSVAI